MWMTARPATHFIPEEYHSSFGTTPVASGVGLHFIPLKVLAYLVALVSSTLLGSIDLL
jgi:hypothetical protein